MIRTKEKTVIFIFFNNNILKQFDYFLCVLSKYRVIQFKVKDFFFNKTNH